MSGIHRCRLSPAFSTCIKLNTRLHCIHIWMTARNTQYRQNVQLGGSRNIVIITGIPSGNVWRISTFSRISFACHFFLKRPIYWLPMYSVFLYCASSVLSSMYRVSVFTEIRLSATFNDRNAMNCIHIFVTNTFWVNLVGLNSSFRYMFSWLIGLLIFR